jgi:lycopene beta-cyclase
LDLVRIDPRTAIQLAAFMTPAPASCSPLAFDWVLIGGGLSNSLLALALHERSLGSVALIERDARIGGNHTWSFHATDVPPTMRALVDDLIVHAWDAYDVIFPDHARVLAVAYRTTTSDRVHDRIAESFAAHPESRLFLSSAVCAIEGAHVTLANGTEVSGRIVVDARGPGALRPDRWDGGFQKFLGLEIELAEEHDLARPIVMDAAVDQSDGFRFLYVLPFSTTRLLIEDTHLSQDPALDERRTKRAIASYARASGWQIERIVRSEKGVLPLPRTIARAQRAEAGLIHAGYLGGQFHPSTGYSFPIALRFAELLASSDPSSLSSSVARFHRRLVKAQRFYLLLNRMLLDGFAAPDR